MLHATNLVGQLWTVEGQNVVVRPCDDEATVILRALSERTTGTGPWQAAITSAAGAFELILQEDGSVTAQTLAPPEWLFPAGTFRSAPTGVQLVGIHPVAGTSTWAILLGGRELTPAMLRNAGPVVGVCRTTPAGIARAKEFVAEVGHENVVAILAVADASGQLQSAARRELHVLSGAVRVVRVPWIKALRGALPHDLAPLMTDRTVAKVRMDLAGSVPTTFFSRITGKSTNRKG
jgi:hypothetical protein